MSAFRLAESSELLEGGRPLSLCRVFALLVKRRLIMATTEERPRAPTSAIAAPQHRGRGTLVRLGRDRTSMTGFASGSPFLTVPELAALLRVPVSWVYEQSRRVGSDAVPCYRAGKRLVFDREEVLAWFLETQRRQLLPVDRRRRRRAPGDGPGGHRAGGPRLTRRSATGASAVAVMLPREGASDA